MMWFEFKRDYEYKICSQRELRELIFFIWVLIKSVIDGEWMHGCFNGSHMDHDVWMIDWMQYNVSMYGFTEVTRDSNWI